MKYSKDAIIRTIEERIVQIEEAEQKQFERRQASIREYLFKQKNARKHAGQALEALKEIELDPNDSEGYKRMVAALEIIGMAADGWSTRQAYVFQQLTLAAQEADEAAKDTSKSDELRAVLDIFKTGAPPEVSVNDLRAFGLMGMIKYTGTR